MPSKKKSSYQKRSKQRLKPLVKWAGGKKQELKYILPELPEFENYYEPFVGGGAVYTAIKANNYYINDKSDELIDLYKVIVSGERDAFFNALEEIIKSWNKLKTIIEKSPIQLVGEYKLFTTDRISHSQLSDTVNDFVSVNSRPFRSLLFRIHRKSYEHFWLELRINLTRKFDRMKKLERLKGKLPDKDIADNIESAIKSAFYMHIRYLYNRHEIEKYSSTLYTAFFLFIRNFAYGGMFRYNNKGQLNVPYGGIAYNRKNFMKKVNYLKSGILKEILEKTVIENKDFETFLKDNQPTPKDFIFLDPPYDTEFTMYANNDFTKKDHKRLAHYLLHDCPAYWMMVIKKTDFIYDLFNQKGINITSFDKTYLVSFMNRNDKETEHLIIKNY